MMKRSIETKTSRTAKLTCLSRAASSMETNGHYKSGDFIAPFLLPKFFKPLLKISLGRKIFSKLVAPKGIYEYVIARTKYIDDVFEQAVKDHFDQVLILGAGFDTRALRFQEIIENTRIFELDMPATQQAKIGQYQIRNLTIPSNLVFIAIDFDNESLPDKLEQAGFCKQERSLFILEGLLMYLQPESVDSTFQTIKNYAGKGSWVVFDTIHASVLRKEGVHYGESEILETVSSVGEGWCFGLDQAEIDHFLDGYEFNLIDRKDSQDLERAYFMDVDGVVIGKVNDTHFLVTAQKR